MRNFVAKNDFNRGGSHKDYKNDYDRTYAQEEIEVGVEEHYVNLSLKAEEGEPIEVPLSEILKSLVDSAPDIALREYARVK